jgi:hypothetical protein
MPKNSCVDLVAGILESYADRGVFRGFSKASSTSTKATFKMSWHRDRLFKLILDVPKKTLRLPVVLPEVPAKSSMYREFQEWVEQRHSKELLEHRRIDRKKAQLRCANRGGNVSLALIVKNGDFEYGTRKLIHAVHETYLTFLADGRYYEYMMETFDLDPDHL